jgi:hypothetical protein
MAAPVWATNDVPTATDFNVWLTNTIAAVKTATESVTSSTTLQNDDHLVLPLAVNSTYWVQGLLLMDGAQSADLKMDFTGPAGASITAHVSGLHLTAVLTADDSVQPIESFGDVAHIGCLGAGTHSSAVFFAIVIVAGTAGNMQLRWAQEVSSATATRVFTGSGMWARRIS